VLHPLLEFKPVAYVGTISYGIYLMHMLAANAVRRAMGHQVGVDVFIATVVLAVVMASISFRWFESPILRLKSRLAGGKRVEPLASVAGTPQAF
jgi:peptidoglycan/LPS O-acetylase OafA/YrhL